MNNKEVIENKAVIITVTGRVQGVGFRYFIATRAALIGVNGYVRNLLNGDMEIYAEGRKELLEDIIDKSRVGPPHSKVKSAKIEWLDFQNKYDNFEIK